MKRTVLHVLEAFAGGTERHLLDLVRHVDDVEHLVAVPSEHHGRSTAAAMKAARAAGARVFPVEMSRGGTAHRNVMASVALLGLMRAFEPDVVHGHSSIGGALARLAALPSRIPFVYTPHGLSRSPWALAVERRLGHWVNCLIAVSASERDFALEHRVVGPDRVVVIPNGIDQTPPSPTTPSLRTRLGVPDGAPLVGCVGRLAWQKAPDVFVEAAALAGQRMPNARFVLVGSGPLQRHVEAAMARSNLGERFTLIPSLPHAAAALADLDLYVLPSRFEGGPYTPLEAMRAGTPVVVSDAAGNRDTVEHGRSGIIVPQDDPYALAQAIVDGLENQALRERLIQGALDSLSCFDVRQMATATAEVYSDQIERGQTLRGAAPDHRGRHRVALPARAAEPARRELVTAGAVVED